MYHVFYCLCLDTDTNCNSEMDCPKYYTALRKALGSKNTEQKRRIKRAFSPQLLTQMIACFMFSQL